MSNESDIRPWSTLRFKVARAFGLRSKLSPPRVWRSDIDVLRSIFADVCSDVHATLLEMDGEDDHVHLLVEYPRKLTVSSLVNSLKGVSSRLLRQQHPDIRKHCRKGAFWSPGSPLL